MICLSFLTSFLFYTLELVFVFIRLMIMNSWKIKATKITSANTFSLTDTAIWLTRSIQWLYVIYNTKYILHNFGMIFGRTIETLECVHKIISIHDLNWEFNVLNCTHLIGMWNMKIFVIMTKIYIWTQHKRRRLAFAFNQRKKNPDEIYTQTVWISLLNNHWIIRWINKWSGWTNSNRDAIFFFSQMITHIRPMKHENNWKTLCDCNDNSSSSTQIHPTLFTSNLWIRLIWFRNCQYNIRRSLFFFLCVVLRLFLLLFNFSVF